MGAIRGQDIYDSSDGVLKQLEEQIASIAEQLKNVVNSAKQVKSSLSKATVTTSAGRKDLDKQEKLTRRLAKANAELKLQENKLAKEIAATKEALRLKRLELKRDARTADLAKDSLEKLGVTYARNVREISRLSKAERENTVNGRALVAQTKRIKAEIDKARASYGSYTTQVGSYQKAVGSLTRSIKSLIGAYIGLFAAQRGVSEVVDQTRDLESLDQAYEKVFGSAIRAAEAQDFVRDITKRYGLDLRSSLRGFVKFNAALEGTGISAATGARTFDKFAKSTAFLGLAVSEQEGVFKALEQILSKGKVQAEELRGQLGDRLAGAFQAAVAAQAVSNEEFEKALRNGEIYADLLPKIADEIERRYNLEEVQEIDRIASSQARLNTAITEFIEALNARGTIKSFYDSLRGGVEFITRNISAIISLIKVIGTLTAAWVTFNVTLRISNALALRNIKIGALWNASLRKQLLTTNLLKTAWVNLTLAVKANPLGVILTVAVALIGIIKSLEKNINETVSAFKSLEQISRDAALAVKEEEIRLTSLNRVLKDKSASDEARTQAYKDIIKGQEEYLGKVSEEDAKIGALTTVIDDYVQALKEEAEIKDIIAQQSGIEAKIKEIDTGEYRESLTALEKTKAILRGFFAATDETGLLPPIRDAITVEEDFKTLQVYLDLERRIQEYADALDVLNKAKLEQKEIDDKIREDEKARKLRLKLEKEIAKLRLKFIRDAEEKEKATLEFSRQEDLKKLAEAERAGVRIRGKGFNDRASLARFYQEKELEITKKWIAKRNELIAKGESDSFDAQVTRLKEQQDARYQVLSESGLSDQQIQAQNDKEFQELVLNNAIAYNKVIRENELLQTSSIEEIKRTSLEDQLLDLRNSQALRVESLKAHGFEILEIEKIFANEAAALRVKVLAQEIKDRQTQFKKESASKKSILAGQRVAFDLRKKGLDDQKKLRDEAIKDEEISEADRARKTIQSEIDNLKEILELKKEYYELFKDEDQQYVEDYIKILEARKLGIKDDEKDIFDLLGFKFDDKEKEAIKSAFGFVKDQLLDLAKVRQQIADQNVDLANQELGFAQDRLNNEQNLRAQGFANQVELRRKEFALARKAQRDALKEQRAAARSQVVIDSIQQTSNLVTASSKILSAFAAQPFIAIPLIATMFGAFIAAKAKALSLTKQEFGGGGLEIIGGGTHASGNDTPLGFQTSSGKQAYGEKGEAHMIFSRKVTQKNKGLLPKVFEAVQNGSMRDVFMKVAGVGNDIVPIIHVANPHHTDLSGTNTRLDTVIENTSKGYDALGRLVRDGNIRYIYE